VISPLLANVFLHYVLDTWIRQEVQPRLRGRAHLICYADDFVILFGREDDARRVMEVTRGQSGGNAKEEKRKPAPGSTARIEKGLENQFGPPNVPYGRDFGLNLSFFWRALRRTRHVFDPFSQLLN
jgi:hypothetical protein